LRRGGGRGGGGGGAASALARDRQVLVKACVEVSDVVSSAALRSQLVDTLADVGVTPIQVRVGERFDPARHRAVDRVVTDDQALDDLVAETERPGYSDRGARLRLPEVLVYSAARGRHRGA
jgi:molecular chaperone GrpE